jgi:hypothetical protein
MRTTAEQVLKLRRERARGLTIEQAAMKAGMHRNTASKHLRSDERPAPSPERSWRTHVDRFNADWPQMEEMLTAAPGLEAKTLFEYLQELRPGVYEAGQVRTFQRRVKRWRATKGPEKEIFFPQAHRPGEAAQTDFTWATELAITIRGEAYDHMLCVTVLPYSLWQWATPCQSESMVALREGVQNAFFCLGAVPTYHQTDNSTAATHKLGRGAGDTGSDTSKTGGRAFNAEYVELMAHLSLKPRTTGVGEKEQNGSIEATNGALKSALDQHLLLRGSRDFLSRGEYATWLGCVLEKRNAQRGARLKDEIDAMRPLGVRRLPAYAVVDVRVGSGSTIRVKDHTYSVPSRLIGEMVRVRIFEERIAVYLGGALMAERERVRGKGAYHIAWRDVVGWMVRKPGALRRYRYRDALFPTAVYARAYERLDESLPTWSADMNYLQVLLLARDGSASDVELVLEELEAAGELARFECVRELVADERPAPPEIVIDDVELGSYDGLTPDAAREVVR